MSNKNSRSNTPHRLSHAPSVVPSPGLHYEIDTKQTPLDQFVPSFRELSDNLVDLDSNVQHVQMIHESLTNFNESFGSFLHGLRMNAYTVEFDESPSLKNFQQDEIREKIDQLERYFREQERASSVDETYQTNEDESFLQQPASSRPATGRPTRSAQATTKMKERVSKIPVVGRRVTGGITKPTKASENRQRPAVQKDKRPPFR